MKTTFSLFLAAIALFLISCEEEAGDNTKPQIILIEPANDDTLAIGEDIHFEADFSDDVELRSYKIDIHSAEGHEHKSTLEGEFSYSHSWELVSGIKETHQHHHEILIPEGVEEGKYHFMVYLLDRAGNESWVAIDVYLSADYHSDDDNHDHDDDHAK